MNPCRCGYAHDPDRQCTCGTGDPERYVRRVSGPMLDRLDMQIEMRRVPPAELLAHAPSESSAVVRKRIAAARAIALARNGGRPNAQLSGAAVVRACATTKSADNILAEMAATSHLSARSVHRLMRVARTIADLGGSVEMTQEHVLAAGGLRDPGAQLAAQLAA